MPLGTTNQLKIIGAGTARLTIEADLTNDEIALVLRHVQDSVQGLIMKGNTLRGEEYNHHIQIIDGFSYYYSETGELLKSIQIYVEFPCNNEQPIKRIREKIDQIIAAIEEAITIIRD